MLKILDATKENLIATQAQNEITSTDYDKLIPLVEKTVKDFEDPRWYFEMEDFRGWKGKALLKELKMDLKYMNDFSKIAMVGEKDWQSWMAGLMKPLTSTEIKYFSVEDKEIAMDWVKN